MKIVYTGGTFDLFHAGHIAFLRECKKAGDVVIVALNTDEFCREYKRPPIMDYGQRKACLMACIYVDLVVRNVGGYDSKVALSVADPDIIAHGDDWTGEPYLKQLGIDAKYLEQNAIEMRYIPYTAGVSTSSLIDKAYDAGRITAHKKQA